MEPVQDLERAGCGCDAPELTSALQSVESAFMAGLELAEPVRDSEDVPLSQALGRVLSAPVKAGLAMPPFDNSAMDGYALRTSDLASGGPWILPVSGRITAGSAEEAELSPGTAQRIFTGAPVPNGADAVVMQERVTRRDDAIELSFRPEPGENIRRRGEDIAQGAQVLAKGTILGPRDIALAAGAGAGTVSVTRQLRIAFLATGDEVQPAGQPLAQGSIWDVNTPMMAAVLSNPSATLISTETVTDDPDLLSQRLQELSRQADLIVTTGGVSVGEEDHMHAAVRSAGGKIHVAGVAVKPGKPLTLARIGGAVCVGLPGNPVSALVTWTVFGRPLMARLSGAAQNVNRYHRVVAYQTLRHKTGRCEFRPARRVSVDANGREVISAGSATHSARLLPLAEADGLVVIPAGVSSVPQGDLLEFLPF